MLFNITYFIEKIKSWQSGSVKKYIFASAFSISFLTGITYIFHAIKDIYAASLFGTSVEFEAFILAYAIPSFVINLIGSPISSALIPVFVDVKSRDNEDSAIRLFNNFLISTTILIIILSFILFITGEFIIKFTAKSLVLESPLTLNLYNFLILSIFLQVLIQLFSALLNASQRFILTSISPIIPSIVTMLFLYLSHKNVNIYALVLGILVGSAVQLTIIIANSYSYKYIRYNFFSYHPMIIMVWKSYIPLLAGSVFACGTIVVDQLMAASLEHKSLAALTYGDRIVSAISSLMVTGIATVTLPVFSRLVAEKQLQKLAEILWFYIKIVLLIGMLISVFFIFFSKDIVKLIWERGAFKGDDTLLVSHIQWIYSLKIPFLLAGTLIVRTLSALSSNYYITIIACTNMISNVILNLILMKFFGAAGIAMSTVIVYLVSFVLLGIVITKILRKTN